MRTLIALFWTLALPAVALFVALAPAMGAITDAGSAWAAAQYYLGCMRIPGLFQPDGCADLGPFILLAGAALATAGLGVIVVLGVNLAAFLTGWNRTLLASTFPGVALVSMLATAVLATAQIGVLAGASYLGMAYWMNGVIVYVPIALGIAALGAGIAVLRASFSLFKRSETSIIGKAVTPDETPKLHHFVEDVAAYLNTRKPDNIIVGLDPTFFATSAHVNVPFDKEPLTGETLYLSLPLMRNLSADELRSIVGHELAHFSGGDTIYSKRFAPVYRGLWESAAALQGDRGNTNYLAYPARMILGHVIAAFSHAESAISRKRELRADQAGARTGSPHGLASSLMRLSVLGAVWNLEYERLVQRMSLGRFSRNISRNFVERAKYDLKHDKLKEFMNKALGEEIAHPTDSHPMTEHRVKSVGIDPIELLNRLDAETMFRSQELPEIGGADLEKLEEEISEAYQYLIIRHMRVDESDETKGFNVYLNLLSAFLAKMVWADGHVDDREIDQAEDAARQYEQAFDESDFRERCRHPEDLPELDKLIEIGNECLNPGGASRLIEVLEKVAMADGQMHGGEAALLARLKAELAGGGEEPVDSAEP